jgi:hypothetical protein
VPSVDVSGDPDHRQRHHRRCFVNGWFGWNNNVSSTAASRSSAGALLRHQRHASKQGRPHRRTTASPSACAGRQQPSFEIGDTLYSRFTSRRSWVTPSPTGIATDGEWRTTPPRSTRCRSASPASAPPAMAARSRSTGAPRKRSSASTCTEKADGCCSASPQLILSRHPPRSGPDLPDEVSTRTVMWLKRGARRRHRDRPHVVGESYGDPRPPAKINWPLRPSR